jgi:hypothetical protein
MFFKKRLHRHFDESGVGEQKAGSQRHLDNVISDRARLGRSENSMVTPASLKTPRTPVRISSPVLFPRIEALMGDSGRFFEFALGCCGLYRNTEVKIVLIALRCLP